MVVVERGCYEEIRCCLSSCGAFAAVEVAVIGRVLAAGGAGSFRSTALGWFSRSLFVAANDTEGLNLLPLIDTLCARGARPHELWAARGCASAALVRALRARKIERRISKRRPAGDQPPRGPPTREVRRGRRRATRTPD